MSSRDPNSFTVLGANAEDHGRDPFRGKLWKCDQCGRVDAWDEESWTWYGNIVKPWSHGGWYDNGTMYWVACSKDCAEKLKARGGGAP